MSTVSKRLRRNLLLTTGIVSAVVGVSTFAGGANAAPAAKSGVDEVVVTAERRTTDVQNTPLAVSAVSAATLDKSFIVSLSGLNATVPSLEITKTSGFENLVTIRGVGSETPENGLTTVPGVSLFVDGVYIANTISLDQTLFDIQSIEVLRGPQGALFGQSSIGGALNIVTQQPVLKTVAGAGDLSGGTYSLFRGRAMLNVPIGDNIALRGSIQHYQHTGFTTNEAIPGNKLDAANDTSGKLAGLWKPIDTFSATLTGQWYHADQAGDAQKNINDPYSDPRKVYQDYPSHFKLDTQLYHLNLQWDLPWFSLKSVSAYQQLYHVQQEDSSRSAFSLLGQYDDVAAWNTNVRNVTEEFDILSPSGQALEWVGGIFLLNQASSQFVVEYGGNTAPTPAQLLIPANVQTSPPGNLNYGNYSYVVRHSASAFAQATWHVTSDFRITGGVRANLDSFSDTSHNFSAFSINTVAHANKDNVTTWRAEADYDVMPDHMVYGSVAKGYKPGGVNGSYGQIVIPALFAPETNTAYEIGSKNYFFDKSLRLNVAAFYYDHKNFQYIETDPFPFDGGIANIPSVHDYGVEFEANYVSPDRRLRVNADLALEKGKVNGSYKAIDSTVANAIIGAGGPCAFGGAYYNPGCWNAIIAAAKNINGATPPAMPEASGSINVSYKFDIPTGAFTPRLEVIYRGSEWARIFNEPSLDKVPAYTVTNLNFEYQPANSALKLSLAATNLFNVAGVNSRYTDPYGTGQTSQQFIPPRQVIGTIAYSF